MKLYIIIGNEESRKSSTIRALTGVRDTKKFKISVPDKRNVIEVYVKTTSFQEANGGTYPKEATIELTNCGCECAIICLWNKSANHPKSKKLMPDFIDYINEFSKAGFTIQSPKIFLDKEDIVMKLSTDILINNTIDKPANEIAALVRKHWNIK